MLHFLIAEQYKFGIGGSTLQAAHARQMRDQRKQNALRQRMARGMAWLLYQGVRSPQENTFLANKILGVVKNEQHIVCIEG